MGHTSPRKETRARSAVRRPLSQSVCPTRWRATSRYTVISVAVAGQSNPWSSELTPKRGRLPVEQTAKSRSVTGCRPGLGRCIVMEGSCQNSQRHHVPANRLSSSRPDTVCRQSSPISNVLRSSWPRPRQKSDTRPGKNGRAWVDHQPWRYDGFLFPNNQSSEHLSMSGTGTDTLAERSGAVGPALPLRLYGRLELLRHAGPFFERELRSWQI
jgi:hypothetical protein